LLKFKQENFTNPTPRYISSDNTLSDTLHITALERNYKITVTEYAGHEFKYASLSYFEIGFRTLAYISETCHEWTE
jgi:hypothetical protein